jgi:lysophospholipase L1-like esterase
MEALTNINAGITGLDFRTTINGNNAIIQADIAVKDLREPLKDLKLVTIGDSITGQKTWQPTIVTLRQLIWSSDETYPGTNGNPAMGIGGSCIIPAVTDSDGRRTGQSIYIRADSVDLYEPDIIILMGGQNDGVVTNTDSYDLSEEAYTGVELPLGDPGMPSFVAAYKGTLLKLVAQNPLARVYACGVLYNYTTPLNYVALQRYKALRNAMKEMCDMYAVTYIDTTVGSNMNPWNNDVFNPAVHPGVSGGIRLGQYIAKCL